MPADNLTCISCGYSLAGLDPSTRCPECALLIADSLKARLASLIEISDYAAVAKRLRVLGVCQIVQAVAYVAFPLAVGFHIPRSALAAALLLISIAPFVGVRLAWWRLASACRGIDSDRIVRSLQTLSGVSALLLFLLAIAIILASGGPSRQHDLILIVPVILWLFAFPFQAGAEYLFFKRLCASANLAPAATWNRSATILWTCGTIGLVACGLGLLLLPFSSASAAAASFSAATRLRVWT